MASQPQGGDPRLAGLGEELRQLRGRLEALRLGLPDRPGAQQPAPAPPAPPPPAPADDEVMARLRGLLDELKTLTGESP